MKAQDLVKARETIEEAGNRLLVIFKAVVAEEARYLSTLDDTREDPKRWSATQRGRFECRTNVYTDDPREWGWKYYRFDEWTVSAKVEGDTIKVTFLEEDCDPTFWDCPVVLFEAADLDAAVRDHIAKLAEIVWEGIAESERASEARARQAEIERERKDREDWERLRLKFGT